MLKFIVRLFALTSLSIAFIQLAQAEEPGVTDTAILIGQTVGLTGPIAGPVKEMNGGARAYLEQVNRRGGVHGRKIELRTLDHRFDPGLAAANAATLINNEHVFALFLNRGTPHTEAILPLVTANNTPLIAPSTGAMMFHKPVNRLLFNVRAKYQNEVEKAIQHFASTGIESIGLVHVDDSFGKDALQGYQAALTQRHLSPALVASFDRTRPDIAGTVRRVLNAEPGALIVIGSAMHVSAIIKNIRGAKNFMPIMTLSNNSAQSFVQDLGAAGAGVIVSQIMPAPDLVSSVLGQELRQATQAIGATASYAAMEGFVAAKILVEGLRRAGPNLTRAGFIKALETLRSFDLGGIAIGYSPTDHTGSEFVELSIIGRDGRFIR